MNRVPDVDRCFVPPDKLTAYLFNPGHPSGGPKGVFLQRFGFDPIELDVVVAALTQHARRHDFEMMVPTPYGPKYTVLGRVTSPDRRNPWIRTVWIIRSRTVPSFVTLVPVKEKEP